MKLSHASKEYVSKDSFPNIWPISCDSFLTIKLEKSFMTKNSATETNNKLCYPLYGLQEIKCTFIRTKNTMFLLQIRCLLVLIFTGYCRECQLQHG